jgi:hypothetical protein
MKKMLLVYFYSLLMQKYSFFSIPHKVFFKIMVIFAPDIKTGTPEQPGGCDERVTCRPVVNLFR